MRHPELLFVPAFIAAIAAIAAIAVMAVMATVVQSQAQKPAFEVASIKPNESGSRASRTSSGPDGSLRATNTTLRGLILSAYEIFDHQLVGGPDWINTARFDVEGRAASGLNDPDVLAMTRSLLEDRFLLRIHRETREMPVFALTVDKDGPKLQPTQNGRSGPGGLRAGQSRSNVTSAGGELSGSGIAIVKLMEMLVPQAGRPIIDRTNLAGTYDFSLKFAPLSANTTVPAGTDSSAPFFFTAIQEQLGLKLEAAKGPVEVLVIDSVAKPSEN
jgi:uncharacterized protein (TIGR03435 family)